MTGYQDPMNPMQQQLQPVKKGWFARSWWWFLPLIIGGPILLCCGSCGGLMWFGMSELQKMPPYVDGVAACENSKEVEALIGSPVEVAGFWDTMSNQGNIEANTGTSGNNFRASIPVNGSTGSGWLYIEADSSNGSTWTYQVLEFEDDATNTVVNLLSSPGITPDPSVEVPEDVQEFLDGLEQPSATACVSTQVMARDGDEALGQREQGGDAAEPARRRCAVRAGDVPSRAGCRGTRDHGAPPAGRAAHPRG